jgi:hypothetical protein
VEMVYRPRPAAVGAVLSSATAGLFLLVAWRTGRSGRAVGGGAA